MITIATPAITVKWRRYNLKDSSSNSPRGMTRRRTGVPAVATATIMRERARLCLQRRYQFEQEQLPPQAHPPEVEALEPSLRPTTAKVENMALVLVLSHLGQPWRWWRL